MGSVSPADRRSRDYGLAAWQWFKLRVCVAGRLYSPRDPCSEIKGYALPKGVDGAKPLAGLRGRAP